MADDYVYQVLKKYRKNGNITPTLKIPTNFEMFQTYIKFLKNIFGFIVDGVIQSARGDFVTDKSKIELKWQNATIRDNFIFSKTLEMYPDICQSLIEKILNIKIKKIHYPEREKVIESRIDSKGIRLDVYIEDNQNRSFNLEKVYS